MTLIKRVIAHISYKDVSQQIVIFWNIHDGIPWRWERHNIKFTERKKKNCRENYKIKETEKHIKQIINFWVK